MGEPFIAGHYVSGSDHEVLFYEGHPNQPCYKMTHRGRLPLTVKETFKENITRVSSPEFNLFHMASPDLERLIVGQSTTREAASTINSSDLNVLNLVSPDFERIISSFQAGEENMLREAVHELRGGHENACGGGEVKSVEQQHEIYTKTFVDALQKMHEQQLNHREQMDKNKIETSYRDLTEMSPKQSSRVIFEHPELFKLHAHVTLSESARDRMESRAREMRNSEVGDEELEMNPSMFPLPPIDLQVQEIVKRERKKQKNRVAASKCRKKKLEREAQLEVTVQQLKERNIELNAVANALRNQVTDLKQRVMEHIACGCQVTSLTMAY